jgi:hypothetical protein
MTDDLPSATPKKSGYYKSARDEPTNEHSGKTQKELKPTETSKRKKPRLTNTEWREFIGILAIVCWIWSEIIRCYDFLILCFLGAALLLFYAAACHFVFKFFRIKSLLHGLLVWILLTIFTAGVVYQNSRPLPRNSTESNPVEVVKNSATSSQTNQPEPQLAVQILANQLQVNANQFSNQLAQEKAKEDALNKALIEAQSATQPRRITPEQRNKFIAFLSDSHASKISVKVIVGNNDSETENFAEQFREMLDAAGYGKNAPQSLAPPIQNMLWVTNKISAAIPPIGEYSSQGIIYLPGLSLGPPIGNGMQKNVEVVAVISNTNSISPKLWPTFMVMKVTTNIPNGGKIFVYHPTDDPNAVIVGICNALIENGISIGFMPGKGILSGDEVAFFIPQKFY